MTPRVVLASLVAYWAGEFANSITLSSLKKATKGKLLWTRTISSTIVGQGLDTVIFIAASFAGAVPRPVLVQMMLAQYFFKIAYETILTPIGVRRVVLESDEVTSLCPVTGQPDWETVHIEFEPGAYCIESKSLKLYLWSFREEGHFCEALAAGSRSPRRPLRAKVADSSDDDRARGHDGMRLDG